MKLEICSYSIESCINAIEAGAHRIELCASPDEGGVTPSLGMIKEAVAKVNSYNNRLQSEQRSIELYVMIRPRGGDFVYSDEEFRVMINDIHILGQMSPTVDGVVLGILLPDGNIDIKRTSELVDAAKQYNFGVTFHRAADRSIAAPETIVSDIIKTGACRILTSGQKQTAPQGIGNIKRMVKAASGRIEIMCGSGITDENAAEMASIGVDAIHSTAKCYRKSVAKSAMKEDNRTMYADKTIIMKILKNLNLLLLFTIFTAALTLSVSCAQNGNQKYRKEIQENREISNEERDALNFLYDYSPLEDITEYGLDFWIANVKQTFKVREMTPWGKSIPESIFRHYVLPLRVNNEAIDSARTIFWNDLEPIIAKCSTMEEAALAVNHWCHEKANYQPTNSRTCSPTAMPLRTYGRCGEESVFAVAALRAAGLPARQIYTPRWAHCDDNHAWIEVWIDGQWKYLGACEPEPALNMAWFTFPASRGLFMQTKVFGRYSGDEEIVKEEPLVTYINATATYAKTSKPVIKVIDQDGNPVKDAVVDYCIYNYSEFYPVATLRSDADGKASLTIGNGDWIIWASKNGKYNFVKVNPKDMSEIEIQLTKNNDDIIDGKYGITPPPGSNIAISVNERERLVNDSLFALEDAKRGEYISTFIKRDESDTMAASYNFSDEERSLLWDLLSESRGNFGEIVAFLKLTENDSNLPDNKMVVALQLLNSLERKDLQDLKGRMLFSHLSEAFRYDNSGRIKEWVKMDKLSGNSIVLKELVSPRIYTEHLTTWRGSINEWIKAKQIIAEGDSDRQIAEKIAGYLKKTIKIDNTTGRKDVHLSPASTLKTLRCEKKSADIFFVACLRSSGIPARLNPIDSKPQYFDNEWITYDIFNSSAKEDAGGKNYGYLMLKCSDSNPLYYINFTVSKMENGKPSLLELGDSSEGDMGEGMRINSIFAEPLKLESGTYLLTTGSRKSDGSVSCEVKTFTISNGATASVEFAVPHIEERFDAIANIPELSKYLPLPDNNYTAVAVISSNNEPTNHLIRDISAMAESFEKYPVKFSFLLRNSAELKQFKENNRQPLPKNLNLMVDSNNIEKIIYNALVSNRLLPKEDQPQLPLLIMVNKKGEVVYLSSGYKIGSGYQISKYLVSTGDNE